MQTPLNLTIFGWLSLRRFLISVSLISCTFLTATSSLFRCPENTTPCPPHPKYFKSVIDSNGISQSSESNYPFIYLGILVEWGRGCWLTLIAFDLVHSSFSDDREERPEAAENSVHPTWFDVETRLGSIWRAVVALGAWDFDGDHWRIDRAFVNVQLAEIVFQT